MKMRTLNCILQDLIQPQFFKKGNSFSEINDGVDMNIPIKAGSLKYSLLSFDISIPRGEVGLFPYFKKKEGVYKMCDYVIFCKHQNCLYVLLIELKKGSEQVMPQLAAGECLARFIVGTLNRLEKKKYSAIFRKIAVRNIHLRRKPTTQVCDVTYDSKGFCTFKGSSFYLLEFLK